MLCGGLAGVLAKTATAPLSRLTILYQIQGLPSPGLSSLPCTAAATAVTPAHSSSMGVCRALTYLVRSEGISSLWRGNLATVLHRLPFSATNFVVYEAATHRLERAAPPAANSPVTCRLAAGGTAGLVACTVAYPLDLLRTRLSAQTGPAAGLSRHGMWTLVQQITRRDGFVGLYRGLGATLLQVVPALALNFTFYDTFKSALCPKRVDIDSSRSSSSSSISNSGSSSSSGSSSGNTCDTCTSLACGSASAICTSTLVFPLDVMRRNMQVQQEALRRSYWSTACQLYSSRGLAGFYRGIAPEYCKVVPGMAIAFASFEFFKRELGV